MNRSVWSRSFRVSLAVVLGAALTGVLLWCAAFAQITLASDLPAYGSDDTAASLASKPGDLAAHTAVRNAQANLLSDASLDSSYKAATPAFVQPGGIVTYTIVLNNDSAVEDVEVLLTDPLDHPLSYVPGSFQIVPSGSGTLIFPKTLSDTAGITWTGAISADGSVTIMFMAEVADTISDGTVITNTATVTPDGSTPIQLPVTVTVDTLPPSVFIVAPEQGQVLTSTYLLVSGMAWDGADRLVPATPVLYPINNPNPFFYYVFWSTAEGATTYLLQEDTSDTFADPTVRYTGSGTQVRIDAQPPGTYYYRVLASDDEGTFSRWSNVVSATIASQSKSPDQYGEAPLAPQQSSGEVAEVWVRIGGAPWQKADGTSEWIHIMMLPQGIDYAAYTIDAYARDVAGNVGETDTIDIYLDTYAPPALIGNLTPGQWISTSYLITGTAGSDQSGVDRVELSMDDGTTWQAASGTSEWSYLWTPTEADGAYTVTARAVDGVGNTGSPDMVDVVLDQPPAAPTGLAVVSTTISTVCLTWTASSEIDVISYTLYWGTTSADYEHSLDVGNVVTYELTGLQSAETYYFALAARDARSEGPLSDEVSAHTGNLRVYLPLISRRWPPIPYAPTLYEIDNDDGDGNYTVSWSYDYSTPTADSYKLQESTDEDFGSYVEYYPGSSTSQSISNQDPGTYYYRVQGRNSYGGGDWSNIETVVVFSAPEAPTLDKIEDPEGDGKYKITWTYDYPFPPVDTYTLQEATNENFTQDVTTYDPGSKKSYTVSGKEGGTYYYRVRGHNIAGAGEWSNVRSVTVVPPRYFDDFGEASGWSYVRGDEIIDEKSAYKLKYRNDNLYTLFVGRFDFGVASPMVKVPDMPYTIKAKVKVVEGEEFDDRSFNIRNGTTFGIVFGGNAGSPCPADRDTAKNDGCMSHYYRLMLVYDVLHLNGYRWSLKRIDYHDPTDDGKGKGVTLVAGDAAPLDAQDWVELRVDVKESGIAVYINGDYEGGTGDKRYVDDPYFGVFMGSPDIGDTGVKWAWYEAKHTGD